MTKIWKHAKQARNLLKLLSATNNK